jgi:RNA polymerase sigma-70 factor (ECF subfamily)
LAHHRTKKNRRADIPSTNNYWSLAAVRRSVPTHTLLRTAAKQRERHMKSRSRSNVLQHLRRAALLRDGAGLTDGQLLEGFAVRRDAACFEALVRRYGPMVLGVCRRVLGNAYDADDAFQATFLVLVRRADSVVPRELVGNWLYGVAYRTALEARRVAMRRQARERQVNEMPHPQVEPEDLWHELQPLLDEELSRLPDKYRAAVVLCDLQGRTRKEAAGQLGVPEGTVSGRLTTARRILARRLARRGVALPLAGLGVALARGSASAAVSGSLVTSTVQAVVLTTTGPAVVAGAATAPVAALTERVVKGPFLAKFKTLTIVLVAVALAGAVGLMTHHLAGAEPRQEAGQESTPEQVAARAVEKSDLEKLQGTWVAVSCERAGKQEIDANIGDHQLVIAGRRLTYRTPRKVDEASFRLRPASNPREIDMEFDEWARTRAIYELDGDRLKLSWSKLGGRPAGFGAEDDDLFTVVFVFERK